MATRRMARLWSIPLLGALSGCTAIPPTVEHDPALPFVELDGYRFHVDIFGAAHLPPVIVVHGGPGGDANYLHALQALAQDYRVIFYDQRGTGLSPRVDQRTLTLESSLADLDAIVRHYQGPHQVRLVGHSWGAMLVVGYLGLHPERVSHAVAVEPGILNPASATAFVSRLKASQSIADSLPLLGAIALTPWVASLDGHERFDFVMTRLMNRAKPGGPYQCPGQSMPPNAFRRAGYGAFANMLKPVLGEPSKFTADLTQHADAYRGQLLMLSSECSFIGYRYQQEFHLPHLPVQTIHQEAKGMGHNMLTLNAAWSNTVIAEFLRRDGASHGSDTALEKY